MIQGFFTPRTRATAAENYSIVIPPPNVTGALHMGHALNGSIQDMLIRGAHAGHTRQVGARHDHAGIATQAQVEKLLAKEGTSRHELGREEFEERVWEWREQYGATIVGQFKRSAPAATTARSTSRWTSATRGRRQSSGLYEKGFIYRDHYMVNWDPGIRSAISDLEVEDREVEGAIYDIRYPLESGEGELTIATRGPRRCSPTRRSRSTRRRALQAPRRAVLDPAAGRPPHPDHRRRPCRPRVRHRRAEDHTRA